MLDKKELLNKINSASDLTDVALFKSVVPEAEEILLQNFDQLEALFDLDEQSVGRWIRGVSHPLPNFRKLIILFIKDRL